MIVVLLSGVAQASVADETEASGGPVMLPNRIHLRLGQVDDTKWHLGRSLTVWNGGNRGFALVGRGLSYAGTDSDGARATYGYQDLAVLDLEEGKEIARTELTPPAVVGAAFGAPPALAMDQASGHLVVAYGQPFKYPGPAEFINPSNPGLVHNGLPRDPCITADDHGEVGCVGGFHVVDAATAEVVRSIDFDSLMLDGLVLAPRLLALRAQEGKIYGFFMDAVAQATPQDTADASPALRVQANPHYLARLDIASGKADWIVRVDVCRGTRERTGYTEHSRTFPIGSPATILPTPEAVWVGCYTSSAHTGTVVRVPLDSEGNAFPHAVTVDANPSPPPASAPAAPSLPVGQAPPQLAFFGPDNTKVMFSDVESGRILLRSNDSSKADEVWWVFDTAASKFIGTIGAGKYNGSAPAASQPILDEVKGRLYVIDKGRGLLTADIRRTPLPQALAFPEFKDLVNAATSNNGPSWIPGVYSDREGVARLYFAISPGTVDHQVREIGIIEDPRPPAMDPLDPGYEGRTLDLDEVAGVTQSTFDGATRGYGARVILVGGLTPVQRLGPIDVYGDVAGTVESSVQGSDAEKAGAPSQVPNACTEANRELVLAFSGPSGPSVVDGAGARAAAQPMAADASLAVDTDSPLSRCGGADWDAVWTAALFGRPPASEPTVPWLIPDEEAYCEAGDESSTGSYGDPVGGNFAAAVDCGPEQVNGWAYTRGLSIEGVSVGQAMSSFQVYRDPSRGIVSRVESVTRGFAVEGILRIATMRSVAESWANGRRQPVPHAERDPGYDPNCDMERTAGTCFRRHIFGVWTPGYQCGPCGSEAQLLDGLNRALGANGVISFRQPDPELARGAENGFIAAVSKPLVERFSDLVLNNDLLQTVVPGVEFIRFAPPAKKTPFGPNGVRGRQVFQFAGVEVSSSYGIQCLLVYDEATNTCAEPAETPGSIQVTLSDTDGKPLAGGAFEVREDVDADGVLGLKDTLLPDGACVTAEDGIGTCTFENLQPGTYLVSQVAAPPGYAKTAEPWVSEVASGEQRTVAFTNVSNVSTIDLKATDENGAPLSGATFAAYPDPDSDGKVAPDAKPAAECTTDDQGVCTMKVPAGSYVLVQTSAPGGLEGIEPVPFTFASGGQVASVTVVNYPPAAPEQPTPAAAPIDYTPPVDYAPPVESVTDFTPVAETPVIEEPVASIPDRIGGTVTQVIRAPGDALRLLARDPKQAVAWTAALALFCLAALAVRRRQQAMELLRAS